ncbi:MAG: four helix bundle protein [Bacteroidales bacterium]|nr:MAG: four helix bundle protein [Bacteroidales bacterium]
MKSYKDLEIYQKAFNLSIRIRNKTLELPNPDKYEVGSQLRRSSQTIKDTIVEGYGRRRYKPDFIKYLVYSHSSLLESQSQVDFLNSIYSKDSWDEISKELDILGAQIYRFIQFVEKDWKTNR